MKQKLKWLIANGKDLPYIPKEVYNSLSNSLKKQIQEYHLKKKNQPKMVNLTKMIHKKAGRFNRNIDLKQTKYAILKDYLETGRLQTNYIIKSLKRN